MSILQNPEIQALLARANSKIQSQKEGIDALKENHDILCFDTPKDVETCESVFNKVKLDAGCPIPTQSITCAEDENTHGPYFKTDKYGRRRLNIHRFALDPQIAYENQTIDTEKKIDTTGPLWFDMKATEITPEIKRDLMIIKNRAALDPKQFYKRENTKRLPKFFQMGTIVESKADFYSGRLTRKERKPTLVDTLLNDFEKKQSLKKSFLAIQARKAGSGRRAYKNKKSKKFNR